MKNREIQEMRNIIITGSSSGMGKALREYFEAKGDNVIGISLEGDDYNCDVSNAEEMRLVFRAIQQKISTVDILICCAGFGIYGAIELIDNARVQKQYDVNVMGTVNAIQNCLPMMSETGKIINFSSICAFFPIPFRSYYCSGKAAISMLSDCLRMELSKTKIQSTAICPGEVKTNFTKIRINTYATNEKYGNAPTHSIEKITLREDKRMPIEKATKILTKIIEKKKLKPQYLMGFKNKLLYVGSKFIPRTWLLKLLTKMFYIEKKD